MRRGLPSALLLAAIALSHPAPLAAHPHVWIDAAPTFAFGEGKLAAIAHRWTFDEVLSAVFIREFDKNRDKSFDDQEQALLFEKTFESLKDYDYFTHLFVDEQRVTLAEVRNFKATVEANGRLTYTFIVPLPRAVDAATSAVRMNVYDDSYYIDISLNRADPARIDGLPTGTCAIEASEGNSDLTNFGLSPTLHIRLRCR